jgi:hypothetical protein
VRGIDVFTVQNGKVTQKIGRALESLVTRLIVLGISLVGLDP